MKTYKYKSYLDNNLYIAKLKKKGNRCYLYLGNKNNSSVMSWDVDRYKNFDFYYFLEPFINPNLPPPNRVDILNYLKQTI